MSAKPLKTSHALKVVRPDRDGDCPTAPFARQLASVGRAIAALDRFRDETPKKLKPLLGFWSEAPVLDELNVRRHGLEAMIGITRASSDIGLYAQAILANGSCASPCISEDEKRKLSQGARDELRRCDAADADNRRLTWSIVKHFEKVLAGDPDATALMELSGLRTVDDGDPVSVAADAVITGVYEITGPHCDVAADRAS